MEINIDLYEKKNNAFAVKKIVNKAYLYYRCKLFTVHTAVLSYTNAWEVLMQSYMPRYLVFNFLIT